MTGPSDDDLLLSNDERIHALEVLSEHFAVGRLDASEFYDRSGEIAQARTLPTVRTAFRGLPGGSPLAVVDGAICKSERAAVPAVRADSAVTSTSKSDANPEWELASLRQRGGLVESIDGVILGVTLIVFLILQFVVGWGYAWLVWPTLIVTLGVPRMLLRFSDEEEEVYEELKEAEAEAKKRRIRLAAKRIRELEGRDE